MTKLEEKLKELGYKKLSIRSLKWAKYSNGYEVLADISNNKVKIVVVLENSYLTEQYEIDDLQQALNERNKDLEELKKYE